MAGGAGWRRAGKRHCSVENRRTSRASSSASGGNIKRSASGAEGVGDREPELSTEVSEQLVLEFAESTGVSGTNPPRRSTPVDLPHARRANRSFLVTGGPSSKSNLDGPSRHQHRDVRYESRPRWVPPNLGFVSGPHYGIRKSCCSSRTTSTGHGAFRTTRSATFPSSMWAIAPRPCEPSTMRSMEWSFA